MGNLVSTPAAECSLGRLTSLSRDIESNTKILTDSLRSKGLKAPSFSPGGQTDFNLTETDDAAQKARAELVALTKELHDTVLGPRESLKNLAWGSVSYIPLQAICEFQIAEAVPIQGSISYQDLSKRIQHLAHIVVPPCDLRRLLRLAMASNVFYEPREGYVAHNSTSLLILEDEALASWVAMFTTDLLGPVANTVAAMKMWPGSQECNQTGVNMSYGHTSSFFDHLQADESRAKRYDLAMRSQGSREGYNISHTVASYPWSKLGKATIVDMGGNQGYVSVALASAFPALSFIVQDLEGTRKENTITTIPTHLSSQVTLTTHDFFEPQTVVADVYLFRHVFHAFSDKYAIQILQALTPALRNGARVVINDFVLPTPGSVSHAEEKSLRIMDVLMKTVCNAREREENDWRSLFEHADARFKWQGSWKSSGRLSFIECTWEDGSEGKNRVGV